MHLLPKTSEFFYPTKSRSQHASPHHELFHPPDPGGLPQKDWPMHQIRPWHGPRCLLALGKKNYTVSTDLLGDQASQKKTLRKKGGKKKVLGKVALKWYSYINYMYKTGFRVEISLDLVNTDQAVTLCPRAAAVCGCNMSNLPTPCKFIRTDTKNYGGHEKDYQNTRLNISIVSIHMQKGCLNIEI